LVGCHSALTQQVSANLVFFALETVMSRNGFFIDFTQMAFVIGERNDFQIVKINLQVASSSIILSLLLSDNPVHLLFSSLHHILWL
jgi:hypothetical protein